MAFCLNAKRSEKPHESFINESPGRKEKNVSTLW